jgi:hypothetical protein
MRLFAVEVAGFLRNFDGDPLDRPLNARLAY